MGATYASPVIPTSRRAVITILSTFLAKRFGSAAAAVLVPAVLLLAAAAALGGAYALGSYQRGVAEESRAVRAKASEITAAAAIVINQARKDIALTYENAARRAAVDVPPTTIADDIRRRACGPTASVRQQASADSGVPVPAGDSGTPADEAAAAADAHDRFLDDLAADARAATLNRIDYEDLQKLVRANTAPE